jgi:hypothetical protein
MRLTLQWRATLSSRICPTHASATVPRVAQRIPFVVGRKFAARTRVFFGLRTPGQNLLVMGSGASYRGARNNAVEIS